MRKTLAVLASIVVSSLVLATSAVADPTPVPATGGVDHFPYSVIYVEDQTTSGLWPVKQAVAQWDLGTNVSIRLGKCQPDAGCVYVTEQSPTDYTWAGLSWNDNVVNNVFTGQSHTILNQTWGQGAALQMRTQVTCHELGHDLGLEYHWYDLSAGSCLYYAADPNAATVPNAYDKAQLNAVYTAPPVVTPPAKHKHPKHHHWHWPHLTWPTAPWRRH